MSYSIFTQTKNDQLQEPMFFGQPVNVSRYDQQKHPIFEQLIEKQLSFFWRPEEIDVSKDRMDYMSLPEHEKHIFISNLKYQTLLDSIQGRSPNAVLLPLVSIPELETWIESWSFSECVVEGTEVLTTDGFKPIEQVTVDDTVVTYDLETETTSFTKPKKVVSYPVENRLLVELKAKNSKQFHQLVTPNHRMPIKTRVNKGHSSTKKFVQAGLFDYLSHHLAPVSGECVNTSAVELTPIMRILIAAQADGSWKPSRYTGSRVGTVPIWFSFSKTSKCDRLISLCSQAGVELAELSGAPASGNKKAQRRFKVNFPIELIPSDIKDFTSWVNLEDVDAQFAKEFLDEVSYWDSHIYMTKKGQKTFTYVTTHKPNADVIQALAVLAGKQARLAIREDTRSPSFNVCYELNVVNRSFKDGQSIRKNLVPYTGHVWCLETTTGAFVIRYRGVTSVTGNTIHSRSYTHIIRNIVNDPSIIFDDIMENEHILARAKDIAVYYDDLYHSSLEYHMTGKGDLRELKKKLYLCLVAINVLEAIRFYVSFACSFAFAERKVMEGNAKIIKMIARDEALHLNGTQHMINLMRNGKDDPEMVEIAEECKLRCMAIFNQAVEQEKDWADYLFKDGSMIGLNKEILHNYIEYIANIRLSAIGLPAVYDTKSNPIPWINTWLSSDNVQVAPQETEITSYLVGQVDNDISDEDLDGFEL